MSFARLWRSANWTAFEAQLDQWTREIADQRVHGATGEVPAVRFAQEAGALRPLGGRAPFGQLRDLGAEFRPIVRSTSISLSNVDMNGL